MSAEAIQLDPDQLEQLADLIADRLGAAHARAVVASAAELVTAEELARILRVDTKSIYRHADELGAVRVGRRLRFDPAAARAAWPPADIVHDAPRHAAARPRTSGSAAPLLPVGRRSP